MKDNFNDLSMTDRALHKINLATIKSDDPHKQWGQQHLIYYIATGRAPFDFVESINQMKEENLIKLIDHCSVGCTDRGISLAKYWLPRLSDHKYCVICHEELIAGDNWYQMRHELVCTKCRPSEIPPLPEFNNRRSEAEITGDYEEAILTRQEMYND